MKTIIISDKAAELIEGIRRDNELNKSCMCSAMQEVINLIADSNTGITVGFNNFYPLVQLSSYQSLCDELCKESD